MRSKVKLNIWDQKLIKTKSRWVGWWRDGWVVGWVEVKAIIRIAYSNEKIGLITALNLKLFDRFYSTFFLDTIQLKTAINIQYHLYTTK